MISIDKNNNRVKFLLTVFLIFLLIWNSVFLIIQSLNKKIKMPVVAIDYGQIFIYPNFVNDGEIISTKALELFFSCIEQTADWCYMGRLEGSCKFDGNNVVENNGKEIVKKHGNHYYSFCQTVSAGTLPIMGEININSAKRNYIYDETLYLCEVNNVKDFDCGNINWENAKYIKAEDGKQTMSDIKMTIPFLARRNTVSLDSNPNVYAMNGHLYIVLDLIPTQFNTDEILCVLEGKLSSNVMEIGKTLINITGSKADFSDMNIKMVVEFTENENKEMRITGRDCIFSGVARLKSLITINIAVDISMSAIINYEKEYYLIDGKEDLLNQF